MGDADRGYFPVEDTPGGDGKPDLLGKLYAPGQAALYEKGVALYISPNTNDNPEWQSTVQHIALEGRCYFISCDMYITRDMYPESLCCRDEIDGLPDTVCRGGSCIVDHTGTT